MAKRTAKGEKKQNGVAKKKMSEDQEVEDTPVIDLEDNADNDADEPSTSAASPKKRARPASRKVKQAKPAAAGSRKTGRSKKAPQRFEAKQEEPKRKKKRSSGGGGGEYTVEAIRGVKKEGGKFQFLIKWENYGEKDVGWEPESNVKNCKSNIMKFLDSVSRHVESYDWYAFQLPENTSSGR